MGGGLTPKEMLFMEALLFTEENFKFFYNLFFFFIIISFLLLLIFLFSYVGYISSNGNVSRKFEKNFSKTILVSITALLINVLSFMIPPTKTIYAFISLFITALLFGSLSISKNENIKK